MTINDYIKILPMAFLSRSLFTSNHSSAKFSISSVKASLSVIIDVITTSKEIISDNSIWMNKIMVQEQGSKCPSLPGFTHWVNPGKPGLGFKPYFGKSGEYWVIKYFKWSVVQNCVNWWILRQVR